VRNTRSFTKSRIVATAALVITTMGVGTVGTAIQALAVPAIPLPISVVQQQSGHTTGVSFNNLDVTATSPAGPFGFPASVGNHITVSFAGVTKSDGSAASDDTAGVGTAGYLAAFCGNKTQGRVGGDVMLTGSDIGSLAGITAHCGPLTPVASTGGTLTVTNLALTVPGAVAAVAAVPDSGVHGSPAVVAGSTTPAVAAVAAVPPADVPATLFTPFRAAGSTTPAVTAVAAVPPADIPAVVDTFVAGTLAVAAAEGTQCVATGTVIPCLLIVASLSQDVALAMPVVNATAVSVVGRVGLYGTPTPVCNPASIAAPPSSCPAARLTTGAPGYPFIFGGAGFIPSANSPALIGTITGFPTGAGLAPGDNFTAVSEKVCSTPDNTSCLAGPANASPASPVGVDAAGNVGGAIVISPAGGVTPGDRFLQVTGVHYVVTGAACPAGFTTVTAGICSITQTHYAQIKIMAATASLAIANGVLTGTSLEPRAHLSMQIKDINGLAVGSPILTDADSTGGVSFTFAGNAFENGPGHDAVKEVVITVTDAAFGAAVPPPFTIAVAATNGAACYSLSGVCNVAELITTSVLPGNIELFANDAVVDIPAVDLSTIDIQDPDTWYPVSDLGAISQVLVGDMRGANSGFVVTATSSDLVGGAQASNVILATDVFVDDSIVCDVYADAGDGNDPLGDIAGGAGQAPADNAGASALADGSQELCTVAPNADGRAAGMFVIDANLIVAGRPTTAADDYTGTLTITITGN